MSCVAFKYNAEKDAREKKERKEKHLKRVEEAKNKSHEPKGEKKSTCRCRLEYRSITSVCFQMRRLARIQGLWRS